MTTIVAAPDAGARPSALDEQRVVDVVRQLALELGCDRAATAVTATASLERDVGLGSLERVELLLRLEEALGRELGDEFLLLETAREIAIALARSPVPHEVLQPVGARPVSATTLSLHDVTSLVEAMERRASAEPARVHVHLRSDAQVQSVTYSELRDGARRIAAGLNARGIKRGEPVAIMLPTGLDYLQSFMGVLTAGAIAVPLYPPARLDRMAEYLERQSRILVNADARILIAMPEAEPVARMLRGAAPAIAIVTAASLRSYGEMATPPDLSERDWALIQYTSGSTGDPKGVLLSHGNLLANIRAIAAGVALRPTDVAVSWLPLYHDMGLIGTWLTSMVEGITIALMSPLAFLARPERWLWAIHQQRATLSAAPNFAYELCVRKIRDDALEGLDLSSWRCACNGSEPVSAATLDRFATRFEHHGFRREAFMPVYGLAESSVALCFPPVGRPPRVDRIAREPFELKGRAVPASAEDTTVLSFVSVGRPLPQHEVRLVDEDGHEVPERIVGRLLFRGPSCTSGYFNNAEATARTLLPGGWLDSGDLAYAGDHECFITGRVKDLIIKAGRNLVPEEIEEVAGSVDGVRKGCVAAFGILDDTSGTERLIVLAESRAVSDEEKSRVEGNVVAAVAAAVGLPPDIVRIVEPGVVPKTPSGKLRRSAAREAFVAGRISGRRRTPLALRYGLLVGKVTSAVRPAVRRIGRGMQVAVLSAAWTLGLVILGPVLLLLMHTLPPGRPIRLLSRVVSRIMVTLSGCRVEVDGGSRIPKRGPLVLVSNHTSYADTPVLLSALPIDFVFVAMKEILSWRLVGTLARRGRHPVVDRWQAQRSVADAAAVESRLRSGEALLFFAEGGFRHASGLRPFRLGAFRAAVASGAPVVPIALRGCRRILPEGARLPRPGRISVWIGDPLMPTGTGWRSIVDLRNRTADQIALHCGEPRLQV